MKRTLPALVFVPRCLLEVIGKETYKATMASIMRHLVSTMSESAVMERNRHPEAVKASSLLTDVWETLLLIS